MVFPPCIWFELKNISVQVIRYLDGIFGARMLALKSLRGDEWAPSSPDINPCE